MHTRRRAGVRHCTLTLVNERCVADAAAPAAAAAAERYHIHWHSVVPWWSKLIEASPRSLGPVPIAHNRKESKRWMARQKRNGTFDATNQSILHAENASERKGVLCKKKTSKRRGETNAVGKEGSLTRCRPIVTVPEGLQVSSILSLVSPPQSFLRNSIRMSLAHI